VVRMIKILELSWGLPMVFRLSRLPEYAEPIESTH
jgi:hypothetical protein